MSGIAPRTLLFTSLVGLATAACGAAPAPAPAPPSLDGPGHLDARLARGAAEYLGVRKIKLRLQKSGSVDKFAVYHGDAAAVPDPVKALAAARFPDASVSHYEHERYADLGEVHEVEVRLKDGRAASSSRPRRRRAPRWTSSPSRSSTRGASTTCVCGRTAA
jgi:hypothetical protein